MLSSRLRNPVRPRPARRRLAGGCPQVDFAGNPACLLLLVRVPSRILTETLLKCGGFDTLAKPLDPNVLAALIRNASRNSRRAPHDTGSRTRSNVPRPGADEPRGSAEVLDTFLDTQQPEPPAHRPRAGAVILQIVITRSARSRWDGDSHSVRWRAWRLLIDFLQFARRRSCDSRPGLPAVHRTDIHLVCLHLARLPFQRGPQAQVVQHRWPQQ